jgi:tetratricopeptide (TPR) repeat protein
MVTRFFIFFLLFSGFCFAHEELSLQIGEISAQIRQTPNDANLYLRRAELNRTDARWKEAERDYLKAKKLAPEMDAADFGLALLYYDTHRFDHSLKVLNQFLGKHPQHAKALVTRARILKRRGDWHQAVEDYSMSLENDADPAVYIERADLLKSQNRIDEAISGLDKGIAALGPAVTLELAAIQLELQLRHYDSALRRLDLIASQAERKEIWLVERADILRTASRNEEAKRNYHDALDAISGLSDSKKNTKATRELEQKIHTALEELDHLPIQ